MVQVPTLHPAQSPQPLPCSHTGLPGNSPNQLIPASGPVHILWPLPGTPCCQPFPTDVLGLQAPRQWLAHSQYSANTSMCLEMESSSGFVWED